MRLPASSFYREVPDDVTPINVAIVGRPNVGKSTLFNRLLSGTQRKKSPIAREAIVSARAGTTRDLKEAHAVFGGLVLRLVDTGGVESADCVRGDSLLKSMERQAMRAVAEAQAVLFVFDAREGVTPLDFRVAELLRERASSAEAPPVILVANKAEGSFIGPYLNDCYELGMGDPVVISAYHNQGMEDLYDRLSLEVGHLQAISAGEEEEASDEEYEEDAEEHAEETDGGEVDDFEEDQLNEEEGDGDAEPVPVPTLPWMPATPLTEEQKRALRWYATHPDDPLGQLDEGLKASALHRDKSDVRKYWLGAPKSALPGPEERDFVLGYRRKQERELPMRLAVVGCPGTGKSSLLNALLQRERSIVDERDGSTMDAVVTDWTFRDQPVKLIDTCGVIRGWNYPGSYADLLQPGMGTRKAIRQAHVVILCVDAQKGFKRHGHIPDRFESTLGNYAVQEGKALVIVVNKWDTIEESRQAKFREEILDRIKDRFPDVKGIPVVFMSARFNLNLATLMTRCLAMYKRWNARLPTGKLNSWLQAWLLRWPPPWRRGQKCSVKYITQTRARPPSFVIWTNNAGEMPRHYIRQLMNNLREEFRIGGVPIRVVLRSTLMPKRGVKLSKSDVRKWKRMGPKQAEAVSNLNSKKMIRRKIKQVD